MKKNVTLKGLSEKERERKKKQKKTLELKEWAYVWKHLHMIRLKEAVISI